MKHIIQFLTALLVLLPASKVSADSSVTTQQPTDATQTRVTLQAAFADGSTENGFQYKYGTIPSVGDFFKYLATATCDPLTITQGRTSWNYVARQKWVESPTSSASTLNAEFSTTVTLTEETTISFDWQVNSEENIGMLQFYVDGTAVKSITGVTDFATVKYSLSAGSHTLKWAYSRSSAENTGLGIGRIKNLNVQNTTAGTWIDTPAAGSSLRLTALYPSQQYLFRAYSKVGGDTVYSDIKQFETTSVSIGKPTVTTTQTTATLSCDVNPGDAEVETGFVLLQRSGSSRSRTSFENALLTAESDNIPVTLSSTGYWYSSSSGYVYNTTKSNYKSFSTTFTLSEPTTISFEYSVSRGRINFYVDGVQTNLINISSYYTTINRLLAAGTHTLKWESYYSSYSYSAYVRNLEVKNTEYSQYNEVQKYVVQPDGNTLSQIAEGLKPNTTYSVYSYMKPTFDSPLEKRWPSEKSDTIVFATKNVSTQADSVTNLMQASATLNGSFDGGDATIVAKGIQYRNAAGTRWSEVTATVDGNKLTANIRNLRPATEFEWRTFIQAQDCDTVYSDIASFTTEAVQALEPTLTSVTQTSAEVQGKVIVGDAIVYAQGIQFRKDWSSEWESMENLGDGDSYFIKEENLEINTDYQARTYVQAAGGDMVYSEVLYFKTLGYLTNLRLSNVTQTSAVVQADIEPSEVTGLTYYFKYKEHVEGVSERDNDAITVEASVDNGVVSAELTGLLAGSFYGFAAVAKTPDGKEYYCSSSNPINTPSVDVRIGTSDITQTSANVNVTYDAGTATISNMQYRLGYGSWQTLTDGKATFTGLSPNTSYRVEVQWTVNGSTYSNSISFRTEYVELYAGWVSAEQTSALVTMGSYTVGTATWKASGIVFRDETYPLIKGEAIRLTGLRPGVEYSYTYFVETLEGGRIEKTGYFRTKSITTITSPATSISNRSATLNGTIECDAYSGAEFGFQWKTKQNWTTDPRFTKGRKNDDGTISVSLVNGMLNPDTEYQFRTAVRYGKNSDGTDVYYYGEWRDFRTELEFVIYPATPYTMYRTDSENNRLVLCGYYVAGSEDVVSQGYEYWRSGSAAAAKGMMTILPNAEQRHTVITDDTMEGSIDLSTLDVGTYIVQAFVKTASATYYGQQLSFTVGSPDAIDGVSGTEPACTTSHNAIVVRNAENLHVRIADMAGRTLYSGRCKSNIETYSVPGGIYIVQFGAERSKKVLVK